jgi:hypothetical protein
MRKFSLALVALSLVGCDSGYPAVSPGKLDASPSTPDTAPPAPDLAPVQPDVLAPSDPPPDPLIGTWVTTYNDTQAIRFKFDVANWEMDTIAPLSDGTYGMVIDQGTYSRTATTATLRVKSSSCQGVRPFSSTTMTMPFTRDGTSLSVTLGTTYLVCQLKTTPPTGMASATIGCFDTAGYWVAHASQPVP